MERHIAVANCQPISKVWTYSGSSSIVPFTQLIGLMRVATLALVVVASGGWEDASGGSGEVSCACS